MQEQVNSQPTTARAYMPEKAKVQHIPVKVYRSTDRIMVATPMPGMLPEDINVKVTASGQLIIDGVPRGVLKGIKELLIDEWSVGSYHRELALPGFVDAARANVTYSNGVLVVALPISSKTTPADLTLQTVGVDHGERIGHTGHTGPLS
jgi:HSP20 family protein